MSLLTTEQQAIENVFGPNADLYRILKIPPSSNSTRIREAFFCLRYDIYQQLSNETNISLGATERRSLEAKMDAITATFRILTDPAKRIQYDQERGQTRDSEPQRSTEEQEELNPIAPSKTSRLQRSVFRRRSRPPGIWTQASSASSSTMEPVIAVPPRASSIAGGIHSVIAPRGVAETVTGGISGQIKKNPITVGASRTSATIKPSPTKSEASWDSIFGVSQMPANVETVSLNQTSDVNDVAKDGDVVAVAAESKTLQPSQHIPVNSQGEKYESQSQMNATYALPDVYASSSAFQHVGPIEEHLPVGVNNLNMREQMLYTSQIMLQNHLKYQETNYHTQGLATLAQPSKIASKYGSEDRVDWRMNEDGGDNDGNEKDSCSESNFGSDRERKKSHKLASPTGVEAFDSKRSSFKSKSKYDDSRNLSVTTDQYFQETKGSTKSKYYYEVDDDTRTSHQDDDTRTYDDDTTTYLDDDTTNCDIGTLGDTLEETTVGDSTYASYDDDGTYLSEAKRYSPNHKSNNRPNPILRSSSGGGVGGKSDSRRVIIHSHRGSKRGGDTNDFSSAACPFPSFTDFREEVRGTYNDATSAFHQVLHAFVISPDDIDKISDKIRDARVEIVESYYKKMKERQAIENSPKNKQ